MNTVFQEQRHQDSFSSFLSCIFIEHYVDSNFMYFLTSKVFEVFFKFGSKYHVSWCILPVRYKRVMLSNVIKGLSFDIALV